MIKESIEVQELIHIKDPVRKIDTSKVETSDQYAPDLPKDIYYSFLTKPSDKTNPQHQKEEKAITGHIHSVLLKFMMMVAAGFTMLMVKNYAGEYQEFINGPLACAMYVIFGSLVISFLFFWVSPKKAVGYALFLIGLAEFIYFISKVLTTTPDQQTFFAGLFGNSFAAADMAAYILGAVIAYMILWMIKSEETELRTEVY